MFDDVRLTRFKGWGLRHESLREGPVPVQAMIRDGWRKESNVITNDPKST